MTFPTDEELLATLNKATADFPPRHPEAESLNSVEYPLALELRKARAVLARFGNHFPGAGEMVSPAPAPAEGEVAELLLLLRSSADARRAADLLEQRHPTPVPVASNTYFEFVISGADDCTQGGGIAPTYAQALSEGQHYLAQCQQDGPHTLELRRVEVLHPDALLEQRHPTPVPVSERLPGPGDCDEKGCCWLWSTDDVDGVGHWSYSHRVWAQEGDATHWLPVTALPLPVGEVG